MKVPTTTLFFKKSDYDLKISKTEIDYARKSGLPNFSDYVKKDGVDDSARKSEFDSFFLI